MNSLAKVWGTLSRLFQQIVPCLVSSVQSSPACSAEYLGARSDTFAIDCKP